MNGKTWRSKDWYWDGVCAVKLDGKVSGDFVVSRGVRQGSVDPLLKKLEA